MKEQSPSRNLVPKALRQLDEDFGKYMDGRVVDRLVANTQQATEQAKGLTELVVFASTNVLRHDVYVASQYRRYEHYASIAKEVKKDKLRRDIANHSKKKKK